MDSMQIQVLEAIRSEIVHCAHAHRTHARTEEDDRQHHPVWRRHGVQEAHGVLHRHRERPHVFKGTGQCLAGAEVSSPTWRLRMRVKGVGLE